MQSLLATSEPLHLFAAGLGAVLTYVFGSKLIVAIYERVTKRNDANNALSAATAGKQIEADTEAFKIIAERLHTVEERLEKKIDKLQDELTSQREMNARKDAKIEHLEADNVRLRDRCNEQQNEIAALRSELNALKLLVVKNSEITNEHPFPVTIVEGE